MTQMEFDLLFNKLVANPWSFTLLKDKEKETRSLFYHYLKNYDVDLIKMSFDCIIRESKMFPSLRSVLDVLESNKIHMPQTKIPPPSMPQTRKEAIKEMMQDARKCILEKDNQDKQASLLAISEEFKRKRNLL